MRWQKIYVVSFPFLSRDIVGFYIVSLKVYLKAGALTPVYTPGN